MLRINQCFRIMALVATLTVGAYAHTAHELVLDVVIDGRAFVLNQRDNTATAPMRGDTFMVRGHVYPGGTLPSGGTAENPAFDIDALEGAIGDWNCRGTFEFDFSDINEGATPHVITTQHYMLDGGDSLVSDGPEGGITVIRPVLGGTGQYIGAQGQVQQETIGVNETGLDNLRFTFTFATPFVVLDSEKMTKADTVAIPTDLQGTADSTAALLKREVQGDLLKGLQVKLVNIDQLNGQVQQETIGVNETGLDNLRFTFTIATPFIVLDSEKMTKADTVAIPTDLQGTADSTAALLKREFQGDLLKGLQVKRVNIDQWPTECLSLLSMR